MSRSNPMHGEEGDLRLPCPKSLWDELFGDGFFRYGIAGIDTAIGSPLKEQVGPTETPHPLEKE